ncbi:MAG: hypothetical protein R3194_12515, partial [Limnobacter sp.]|nr:hypothetical protein [Limnobacter sp.]
QGGAMWCGLSDKAKKSDQPLQLQEEIGHQLLEREERPPVLLMLGLRSYQMLSGLEENDLQTMPFAEPQTLQIAGSGYKAVVIPALKDLREQPLLKRQAWRGLLAVSDLLQ